MNKYGAKKVTFDGIEFDSQREFTYYLDYKALQKAGQISHLKVHPQFRCEVNGKLIGKYTADFEFVENGRRRVIDVKNPVTARKADFRLRKKLVEALHGIDVEVVL